MMNEQHKRVLVVDDDVEVRKILASALAPRGLLVDLAADGNAAVSLLAENQYAVVLLDLVMPDADGFHVLDALRQGAMQSSPVVLVLTGAEPEIAERLDSQRIHGLIRKPFDPQDIASLVVACSEIKSRNSFGTMAIATTMIGGAKLLSWLMKG